MVSGFVYKPEMTSAQEAIQLLEKAISDNCPEYEECEQAEQLLEQAKYNYEICQYSRDVFLNFEISIFNK